MLMSQFDFGDCAMEDAGTEEMVPETSYNAPFDPNVLYVHYEAAAVDECFNAWGPDELQRKAAVEAISRSITEREAMPGIAGDDDAEIMRLRGFKKALNRLETRHKIAAELKASLPQAAESGPLQGALVSREEYVYLADGEARRYAKGELWKDEDGKWRSATSQGMPGDLRTKVLGWKLADKDGRKSDPTIYVIVAYRLGLPRSSVNVLIDEYLISDEVCEAWHDGVAEHHGTDPKIVKRWPNILGNGGAYKTCLKQADLPLDSPPDERVLRMERQLKKLRPLIMQASRGKPNALWPGSHDFVDRHDARLQCERPDLKEHERFNKVFSYLIETAEDKILAIHAQAQRSARRDAIGHAEFDAMAPDCRDTGGYCFDGLMTERTGGDPEAGDRAAEKAIVDAGWHAQAWGIEYKIVEKPMFGKQDVHPDDFESAKGARRAMQEAAAAYPEVRDAIASPSTYRRSAPITASGNASIIPVHNGRALLTIEVCDGQKKYGLFGGKAEAGETLAMTAAREAYEESGKTLSDATRNVISALDSSMFKECRAASMCVAVVPVGDEDLNAPSLFDGTIANRQGSKTKHVGIEWVDIASTLLNYNWRKVEMHYHASLMAVSVREALQAHATMTAPVCGEKRPRDEDDSDDEAAGEESGYADEDEADSDEDDYHLSEVDDGDCPLDDEHL